MSYIGWALTGMTGYSLVTLFVKLATRSGRLSSFAVLAIATVMVSVSAVVIVMVRGDFRGLDLEMLKGSELYFAGLAGISLTIAVTSLFRALSLGPASVVVPVYGMFIIGGALLGVLFLGETVTLRKVVGLALAIASVLLIAGSPGR